MPFSKVGLNNEAISIINVLIFVFVLLGLILVVPNIFDLSDIEGGDNTTGTLSIDQESMDGVAENSADFVSKVSSRFRILNPEHGDPFANSLFSDIVLQVTLIFFLLFIAFIAFFFGAREQALSPSKASVSRIVIIGVMLFALMIFINLINVVF